MMVDGCMVAPEKQNPPAICSERVPKVQPINI
jgi:hypothetical protein